ncbi:MAG: ubiquinone biosynthesis accessory factor UbiJ [Pontibacterium sp.]
MIQMLSATAFTVAEQTINSLLKRDSVTLERLDQLSGKIIAVHLTVPELMIYLLPTPEGLQIQAHLEDDADVTLSGGPADFIKLLSSDEKADALFGKGISITGDSGLANRFQNILADTQIDWEGLLGDIIGDLPAHQAAQFFGWKLANYRRTGSSLIHNLEEYLTEEARLLPTQPEVDGFLQEVDQLRDSAERLNARFQQLKQKLQSASSQA